jgi:hypothetical protein
MPRPTQTRFVIAVVIPAIACSSSAVGRAPSLDPKPLAGCYAVTIGPWTMTGGAMGLVPPERFQLETAVILETTSPRTQYRVVPQRPLRPSLDAMPATWTPLGTDSLSVAWFNRYALGSLTLRVVGDSVAGVAHTRSDVITGSPHPSAPVAGRRVECAGEGELSR